MRVRPSERAEMDWKIGGITLFKKKIIVSLFRMDNLNAQYSRTEGDINKVLPFFYFRSGTLHS